MWTRLTMTSRIGLQWRQSRKILSSFEPLFAVNNNYCQPSRSFSNRSLTSPNEGDAQELFRRMNSRPESIITASIGDPQDLQGKLLKYNQDWTKRYKGNSSIVVRPQSTEEVSNILEYCNERRIGVVPQGGNTGLVGGSVPLADHDHLILSTERMNQIHGLDLQQGILQCQSGCVLEELQNYTKVQDHLVPVDLGAKGTCQIGGNLSTNAGGSYYYRYGSLHANTVGLEVVLADGSVLNLGYNPCLLKDNTGYELKHLFIGAEGTLGVITNVALLCPRLPKSKGAAFLACASYEEVCHLLDLAKGELGEILAAFEFMDESVLEVVLDTMGETVSLPLEGIPSYAVIVETHGSNEEHDRAKLEEFVEFALVHDLVQDGALAQNLGQVQSFWKIRESCNPCVAQQGYVYKYDVSLGIAEFEDFSHEIQKGLRSSPALPGNILYTNWGHVIDGNLHLNVVVPGQMERDESLYHRLEEIVLKGINSRGGSISAEHGLGQYKNKYMTTIKDAATLKSMKRVKDMFDPTGILNPGKYLPS